MGIQSQTLSPNDYYEVPLSCFSGYIRNNNATECQILILGNGNSTYNETIPPYSVLHTTNAEYNRIYNEGAVDLILVYVDNPKTTLTFQNSSINIQSAGTTLDIGTVDTINNITSLPDITLASGQTIGLTAGTSIDIGNITGTISDITLAAGQTVDVGTLNSITEIAAGAIKTTGNTNNGLTATLATANTAQQFTTTSTPVQHFQLRNTSSENIEIGNSTVQATLLFPNSMFIWDAILTETTDLSTWYFNGATAGDTISVNYQA